MWGPLCLLWMLIWTTSGAPSISTVCPENCECSTSNEGLKAHCSSTEFLSKLRPKQRHEIVELDLSGTSVKIIDHKLRKLKNLRKLDLSKNNIEELKNFPHLPHLTHLYLSQNHIKQFTASDLPKSVEHLDLSSNRIANVTDISKLLPNLVEINFNDNILSCQCDFLKYRDVLHQNGVHIVRPASCYTPESVRGISMLSVYCAFGKVAYDNWDDMLGDEPGSGEDIGVIAAASRSSAILDFDKNEGVEEEDSAAYDKIEEEYFPTNIDSSSSSPSESDEDSFEGSGSTLFDIRGSGDGEVIPILPDPNVSHCYYNCSTPSPVEDSNKSAPPASISQEINRLFKQITGNEEPSTTTTTSTPVEEEEIKQRGVVPVFKGVPKEAPPVKEQESEKIRAAADVPEDRQTTADTSEGNNTTTYVVVGVLFAAMVVLIAYVVIKKRTQRNNNRRPSSNQDVKEPQPVEMKPLMTDTTPTKPITVPERTPLMNGQNGTNKKSEVDEPAHQEADVTDSKPPVENGIDVPEEEEPQLRPKQDEGVLLTPSTKRVTIQAKELSSPKSPVLVHRHLGDDGTIFITPPVSKSEKYT